MSTPIISAKSKVAGALAGTLGKSVGELDAMDGTSDGQIEFYMISRGSKLTKLNGRIAPDSNIGWGACENAFVIDNGDGKIGKGDLFLHADGWYEGFRFAKLFESRKLNPNRDYDARSNSDLTPEAERVMQAVEQKKGMSFTDELIRTAMRKVCR